MHLVDKEERLIKIIQENKCAMLAFTATPWVEKLSVYELFGFRDLHDTSPDSVKNKKQNPVSPYPIRMAIEDGFNSPVVTMVYHPEKTVNFKIGSNNEISEKERVVLISLYFKMMASIYLNDGDPVSKKKFRGLQGIMFCVSVKHAQEMSKIFNEFDVDVAQVKKLAEDMQRNDKTMTEEQALLMAKRKIRHDLIHPTHRLRNAYRDNIKKEMLDNFNKKHSSDQVLTTEIQNQMDAKASSEAERTFCIAEAIYAQTQVHRDMSKEKYTAIIRRYKMGGILLLTNAMKLTEGFNHPELSLVINARPSNSRKLKTQCVGRGLRLSLDKIPHKICYNIDIAWNKSQKLAYFHQIIRDEADAPCFSLGAVEKNRVLQAKLDASLGIQYEQTSIHFPDAVAIKYVQTESNASSLQFASISKARNKKRTTSRLNNKVSMQNTTMTIEDCIVAIKASSEKLKKTVKLMQVLAKSNDISIEDVKISDDDPKLNQKEDPSSAIAIVNDIMDSKDEAEVVHVKQTLRGSIVVPILESMDIAVSEMSRVRNLFVSKHQILTDNNSEDSNDDNKVQTEGATSSSAAQSHDKINTKSSSETEITEASDTAMMCQKLNDITTRLDMMRNRLKEIIDNAIAGHTIDGVSTSVNKMKFQSELQNVKESMLSMQKEFDALAIELNIKSMALSATFSRTKNRHYHKVKLIPTSKKRRRELDAEALEKVKQHTSEKTNLKKQKIIGFLNGATIPKTLLGLLDYVSSSRYFTKGFRYGATAIAMQMIENNPNVLKERDDLTGDSILHRVIQKHSDTALFEVLLTHYKCDINLANNIGETPIFNLIRRGADADELAFCIKHGANINKINATNETVLDVAINHCVDKPQLIMNVGFLIAFGATFDAALSSKYSVSPNISALLKLENITNKNIRFLDGSSLLQNLLDYKHATNLLLQYDVTPSFSFKNEDELTLLHVLAKERELSILEMYAAYFKRKVNASPNLEDLLSLQTNRGCTPLHLATEINFSLRYIAGMLQLVSAKSLSIRDLKV